MLPFLTWLPQICFLVLTARSRLVSARPGYETSREKGCSYEYAERTRLTPDRETHAAGKSHAYVRKYSEIAW